MTDKQSDALRLADELEDSLESHDGSSLTARCQGIANDAAAELRRQYAELETLRTGYEAARLEIESLRGCGVEPAGEYPALPGRTIGELTESQRESAIAAYRAAHEQDPDFGFAPDRAWVEGAAYVDALAAGQATTAQPAPAVVAGPSRDLHPEKCPITGRPFFMTLDHPELGGVPTYGGPYDSYTIPAPEGEPTDPWHERELRSERYDHDAGWWVEGGEPIPLRIVHEDVLFKLQEDAEAAAPTTQPSPQQEAQSALFDKQGFREWVLHNLPYDTIIGNSAYWADHLSKGIQHFVKAAPQPSPPQEAQADSVLKDADTGRLDWLERHSDGFYNLDRISSIVGKGFLTGPLAPGLQTNHATLREAIDSARKQGGAA